MILKTDYFQLWFLQRSGLRISTAAQHTGILNTFKSRKKYNIFHIIDQIKVQGYRNESGTGIAIFAWMAMKLR